MARILSKKIVTQDVSFSPKEEFNLAQLIKNASEIIIVVNKDLEIKYISPSVEKVLGYKHYQLINKNALNLVMKSERMRILTGFKKFLRRPNKVLKRTFHFKNSSGKWRLLEITGYNLIDDKNVHGVVVSAFDVTEKEEIHKSLLESERKLRLITRNMSDTLIVYDMNQNLQYVNPAFEKLTGYDVNELYKNKIIDYIHPDDQVQFKKLWRELFQGKSFKEEFRIITKNGKVKWCSSVWKPLLDEKNKQIGIQGKEWDITEQKIAEEALIMSEAKMQMITSQMPIIMWTTDTSLRVNSSVGARLMDINKNPDDFIGKTIFEQFGTTDVDAPSIKAHKEALKGKSSHFEYQTENRNFDVRVDPLRNIDGWVQGCIAIAMDITERKKSEEQVYNLAFYDQLTGLPNRSLFNEHLKTELNNAKRNRKHLAVMFLDLDRFKNINDSLGHNVGDLLLQSVAERLKSCIRDTDMVSRQGGDEFTIILTNLSDIASIIKIAQKILEVMSTPFILNGHEIYISPSIGISVSPNDGKNAEELIMNADTAMYVCKRRGGKFYEFYSKGMNVKAHERLELENSLNQAVLRNSFLLHYQPKINLNTGKIAGFEALIRWQRMRKNKRSGKERIEIVSPGEFIPIAEETGLIVDIGEWTLRQACKQISMWEKKGYKVKVAINISLKQFSKNIVEIIKKVLAEYKLNSSCLEIELTESTIMNNPDLNISMLKELRDAGFKIAIDDFGTGYSSLSYLKRLPIDILKIDRSFIKNIDKNNEDAAIVKAIISMAHSMNKTVVAEGVETKRQMDFLKSVGCDEMQGFYFSRPIEAKLCKRFLSNIQCRGS